MSIGQLGVLHTNSSFAPSAPNLPIYGEDVKMQIIAAQIAILKNKENAFANRFGFSNLKDFIAGVRKILQSSPSDMKALQRFSSNNLQKYLEQFKAANSNMFLNQEIRITVKGFSEKIGDLFDSSGSNEGIEWVMDGPNSYITSTWNTSVIKRIVNKTYGTHYNTKSDNTTRVVNFLRSSANDILKIEIGPQKQSIDQFVVNNATSPFQLKPTEFEKIAKDNPQLATQLKLRILSFISNTLCEGASKEFISAAQMIMGSKFTTLESMSFFMGGKGWTTHALGAFGELQTAIMFQYIANKTSNKMLAAGIAKIIGDERNGYNQQFHTDLEILKAFGIQVKNYGGATDFKTGMEKTVNVHLHPSEISSLGASEGAADYIVNSYFNLSVNPYPESSLNEFFKSHASELLNLDFNPSIPDQVSFYMIGSNLIPGSAILEQAFQEVTIKVNTEISGTKGRTDVGYAAGEHPPFLEWWQGNKYIGWEPTGQNSISAWDKNVSIVTHFTYSAIFEGAYKLF